MLLERKAEININKVLYLHMSFELMLASHVKTKGNNNNWFA